MIAYVRHHLQFAGLLRIDHVMGLHRIFVIPRGLEARDGFYLRYPAEELYAILSLESHRYKSTIVGENLGTVPPEVNPSLRRYHIQGMYVMQYELTPDANRPLRVVPSDVVASINTHDMPPFAAFWQGLDIEARHELGLLKSRGAQMEQQNRRALRAALSQFLQGQGWLSGPTDDAYAVLRACLAWLSASRARIGRDPDGTIQIFRPYKAGHGLKLAGRPELGKHVTGEDVRPPLCVRPLPGGDGGRVYNFASSTCTRP